MLETIFHGIFDSSSTTVISVGNFLLCVLCSLVIGLVLAFMYIYRTRCTKNFAITLALLPAVVCVIIMMVNGNIGAGVAVAGAFSLVRFRSLPGTAKEIGVLFLAMGTGLIAGMGYLAYALLFCLILGGAGMLYSRINFGGAREAQHKTLRITIPEDMDYTGVFDSLFHDYATEWELKQVKTTNMGSLFKLTYDLTLRDGAKEKELIDKLRCRNGNLEITVSCQETEASAL